MEQSHSPETNSHSATQEILHLLENPKVHYRINKSHLEQDEFRRHFPTLFPEDPF
jgi:hypothetical protein